MNDPAIEREIERQNRKAIEDEFGHGRLNDNSRWWIAYKDGSFDSCWARDAQEALEGIDRSLIREVSRYPDFEITEEILEALAALPQPPDDDYPWDALPDNRLRKK